MSQGWLSQGGGGDIQWDLNVKKYVSAHFEKCLLTSYTENDVGIHILKFFSGANVLEKYMHSTCLWLASCRNEKRGGGHDHFDIRFGLDGWSWRGFSLYLRPSFIVHPYAIFSFFSLSNLVVSHRRIIATILACKYNIPPLSAPIFLSFYFLLSLFCTCPPLWVFRAQKKKSAGENKGNE